MKAIDLLLLRGLKRKLGKLLEALGATGIALSSVGLGDLPFPADKKALSVFAVGVMLKLLGELDAKLRGAK